MIDDVTWQQFTRFAVTKLHYKPITCKDRKMKLRHLIRHGINIDDPESCYDYFADRISKGTKGFQLNDYIKSLNAWMKFRNIDHHFTRFTPRYKPIKIPDGEEINRVIRMCSKDKIGKLVRTTTFVSAHTGIRIQELCGIKLCDIDWDHNKITVTGKNDKTRIIPVKSHVLHGHNCPSIYNYIKVHRLNTNDVYLFTWTNGKLLEATLRKFFKKAAKQAGLGWLHPHSLRHYYATNLLRNNVNIKLVQLLLGHSNIKTTSRYLHMVEHDLDHAIDGVDFKGLMRGKTIDYDFWDLLSKVTGETGNSPVRIYTNQQIGFHQQTPVEGVHRFTGEIGFV